MRRFGKISLFITCVIAGISLATTNVNAANSVNISADKTEMAVGDNVVITVSASGGDDAAVAPEISVTYDPNRLSFVDCNVSYGGGSGGLISLTEKDANITFNTVSGGNATVSVNAVFDGDGANAASSDVTLSVEGEDTASQMGEEAMAGTGIEAGSVTSADGTKLVSSVFADEMMPAGFYKTTVSYEEQMVEAAQFDMGNIVLLYVTDPDGSNGNFDIYNQETGELSDFLQIAGIENRFIIALKAPETVEPPKNFTKATLQWNSQVLEAYAYSGTVDDATVNINEFFILYAVSSEGNTGWYMYDQNEGTYQRYVPGLHGGKNVEETGGILSAITSSSSEDTESGGLDVKLIIIGVLAVIAIIFVVLFIITLIKLKDYESYDYIDEDEELEATQIELGNQPSFVRNQPTEDLPVVDDKEIERADTEFKVRKVKASDIAERELGMRTPDDMDDMDEIDDLEDDSFFSPRKKASKEDKKLAKAEAKAAKKAAKKMKKEYGENGYVDWESFGETMKQNDSRMPDAVPNPHYVEEIEEAPVRENVPVRQPADQKAVVTPVKKVKEQAPPAQKPVKRQPVNYDDIPEKENPMEAIKNLPANDYNRPVQPKPVQQYDLDDDFEFEFLKLDDD